VTLEQLRIFVAVAEREHVTRAAALLGLTQSATSAAIQALERRHGTVLFDRVGRNVVLTEAGRAFLIEARALLARAESAETVLAELAGLRRGTLPVQASQTIAAYWLPAHLVHFHAQWPDIDPPRFGYKPLLYWCLTAGMWSQAECLMESGLAFKVVWDKFHDGVDPGHKPFILRATLYKRFIERETRCQQCVTTLLSAAWRKRYRLPKDMARAMAKEVWLTRRKEVWETEESLEQWKGLVAR